MNIQKIRKFIEEKKIDADIIEHSASDGLTSQGAANAIGTNLDNIIKVLLFIGKKRNKALIIAQGNKKINSKSIPGLKKPRMTTAEELKEFLDSEPGGVSPVGLPDEIPKFIDTGLKEKDFVFGSAGNRFTGLKIKVEDIIKNNKNIQWKELTLK